MTGSKSVSEPGAALRRVRVAGLIFALAGALLVAAAGDMLRRTLFDAWQQLAPRDLSDTNVRVVEIDTASLQAIGGWPWSRYHVARLTEEIASRGAAAIGFDIIFDGEDPLGPKTLVGLYPELDQATAERIRALPSNDDVLSQVLGASRAVLGRAGADGGGADPAGLAIEARITGTLPPEVISFPRADVSIPQLELVALGHGLIGGEPDADGVIRKVPLIARLGTRPHPSLSLELARVAQGLDGIVAEPGAIRIGRHRVPVDRAGHMRLHTGIFPPEARISALDLFREGDFDAALTGKTVLIGVVAEGTEDVVTTPIERSTFGIYTHALAIDALLRGGGWLERPRWASGAEWLVGLLLALLVIYALPRRGPLQLLLPAAILLLAGTSWFAFRTGAVLLDPLGPALLGVSAAAGVGLASFRETRRERERLRDALVEQRVAAARVEEEMAQARNIQRSMLPPPRYLAELDPRLDVAALLEPARSVGGDFLDAIQLDCDRIAFCIADVTGKGVPAALFMALSKALSRSVLLREPNLGSAARLLNGELSRDEIDSGVTMLIGVIDLATGDIALVNAGHDNPFRIAADGRVRDVAMDGGPPFCILDYPWPIEHQRLATGEALVLVTDGVPEAQNPERAFFGRERAIAALRTAADGDAQALATALVRSVRAFEAGAEPSDDLTVMVLRYRG